ncbi:hypothetical protein [Mucilaginibacter polytrichastri]|nr:hypothetical protein [Mucilaginibacter polytrichastri]SFS90756.1 hypothetical protein SAMN04487890_10643 [Mucilaginibacter polytrichastri]
MNKKLPPAIFAALIFYLPITLSSCHPQQKLQAEITHKKHTETKENQAVNLIINLDEVNRKSAEVKKDSKGKQHLAIYAETLPTDTDPNYWVKVAEDNGDNYVAYYTFAVNIKTRTIEYYDVMQNSLITLSKWRKSTPIDEQ